MSDRLSFADKFDVRASRFDLDRVLFSQEMGSPGQEKQRVLKEKERKEPAQAAAQTELLPQETGIRRNKHGLIDEIIYPGGKGSAKLSRDENGNLASLILKDQDGTRRFTKLGGKWCYELQGMQLPLPGQIKVSAKGDISTDLGDGVWQTVRSDGSTIREKTNACGGRVSLDKQGRVDTITRKDGTSLEAHYDGGTLTRISESGPDGRSPCLWTRKGDVWTSDSKPPQQRLNFQLENNGNVSFKTGDGLTHIIRGSGRELIESASLAKFQFDLQGRISSIDYSDGRKSKFTYIGAGNKLENITLDDGHKNTRTYARDGSSDRWTVSNDAGKKLGTWRGQVLVAEDGTFSNRRSAGSGGTDPLDFECRRHENNNDDNPDNYWQHWWEQNQNDDQNAADSDGSDGGVPAHVSRAAERTSKDDWTALRPDGSIVSEQLNPDGSRTVFDKNKQLVGYQGKGGCSFERLQVNGKDLLSSYNPENGLTLTWTKDSSGFWNCDSCQGGPPRKDLTFDAHGVMSYINDQGASVQEYPDRSMQVRQKDGSIIEFNKDGQISKEKKGDLERTFVRDANGIVRVEDVNSKTKEERTVFERRPPDQENRTHFHLSKTGDFSYQNPDGTAVIERSNMLHLDLDRDGDITRVVGPKSTREFNYIEQGGQKKELVRITDSRQTEKGIKTETWTRGANLDGTLSNEFLDSRSSGRPHPPRYGIVVCADGEFEYKLAGDKPGEKAHLARLAGEENDNGFSDSVADARDKLTEAMDSHLDAAGKARLAAIMTSFEERARDRVEAETAGGKDADKAQEEWDMKVTHTYDHLAHMLSDNAGKAVYDLNTRAKLVQDALYSMAWPAKADDQGDWGCCWQISTVYLGVVQDPNKMAKMLDQLSTTGTFTDTRGKTWTPPKSLLSFTSDGANWTMENCGEMAQRNPCSEIWVSVAAYLSEDGGRTDRGSNGGDPDSSLHAMKLITGDSWRGTTEDEMTSARYKNDLLLKGGVFLNLPDHMYLGTLVKNKGQWQIVSSEQHGDDERVVDGVVTDLKNWNVRHIHSSYVPDIPRAVRIANDRPIGGSHDYYSSLLKRQNY